MRYKNSDPLTGIEVIAEHQWGSGCTVTTRVPTYDGTDDAEALKMQVRAADQVFFALDVMARAVPDSPPVHSGRASQTLGLRR